MLGIIKNELNANAVGSRIEKVTMPAKDRVILWLSAKGFSKKLLISCSPSSPKIHYTNQKYENPATPPMICMLLRKRLTSGRLKGVRQAGLDRILFLDFDCKNELGDDITVTVAVEIMGRLSNIILLQNDHIIDSVRRFDPEEGKRFVLPGAEYELPESQNKIDILSNEIDIVTNRIKESNLPLNKAICSVIDGISPIIGREIAHLSVTDMDKPANLLNSYEINKLKAELEKLKDSMTDSPKPQIIYDEKGTPKDFTFIDITQYGKKFSIKQFDSVDEMLDEFFSVKETSELLNRQSSDMLKLMNNLSDRINRKIHNREKELKATESREKYRIYGELIKTNLHTIQSGDSFVDCVNYYDENCAGIRIPLDVTLSPSKNAQKYFKEYRKLSNAAGMLNGLIVDAKAELSYVESVFDSLCRAKTVTDIMQIREELIEAGYIKLKSKGKRQKLAKSEPYRFTSSDGFEILVGKNNHQNDELTLKIAEKKDIWMHTKDIAGSHVIVRSNGQNVPDSTLVFAANLAAKHSKAASSHAVPVDYALAKYVKKPAGAKPGMVIYTTNKTIYANPLDID